MLIKVDILYTQEDEEVVKPPIYLASDSIDIKDYVPQDKMNTSRISELIPNFTILNRRRTSEDIDPNYHLKLQMKHMTV